MRHITPTHDVLVLRILPYLCISRNGLRGWINQIETITKRKVLATGTIDIFKSDCNFLFLKLMPEEKQFANIFIIYRRKNLLSVAFEEISKSGKPSFVLNTFDIPKEKTKSEYIREVIKAYNYTRDDNSGWIYSNRNENTIEISMVKTMNLGHQIMNQFSGAIFGSACIRAYEPSLRIVYTYEKTTNYFPAEVLAFRDSGDESRGYIQETKKIRFSSNFLVNFESTVPEYKLSNLFIERRVRRDRLRRTSLEAKQIVKNKRGTELKIKKETQVIIFSIKAGGKTFSNTQFPIAEAIDITIKTISILAAQKSKRFKFIIDGLTSPYKYNSKDEELVEPSQRRKFRENEIYWLNIIKEQLREIPLLYINGMDVIEKYPYYRSASKFIRFGDGSYQMVWYAMNDSTPKNHLGVMCQQSEEKSKKELQNLAADNWKCIFHERAISSTAENIINWIEQ